MTIAVGERVWWDGTAWTVVTFDGAHVTVRSNQGRCVAVEIRTMVQDLGGPEPTDAPEPAKERALGPVLDGLDADAREDLKTRVADVLEVLTGFRSGLTEAALPGEPRDAYAPGTKLTDRYRAMAEERGTSVSTVRRMIRNFQTNGPAGLIDERSNKPTSLFGKVDQRWIDVAASVLTEHTRASRPSMKAIAYRTNARVTKEFAAGEVPIPSTATATRVIKTLAGDTNALKGATKQKRSIANRPAAPYGRLVTTRPGEFLLLDSTTTDVFALDRRTNTWTNTQLTVAIDLFSGVIVSLRLNPVSTKSIDAALVLFEALVPSQRVPSTTGVLPYVGVPSLTLIPEERFDYELGGLPSVAVESAVIDHGRIWVSLHFLSVCERLAISVQPARRRTPTDKGAVERFFRTLREGLLQYLPGYKGPDVFSRGAEPELEAHYYIDELEQIMRDWIVEVYHERPSGARSMPDAPHVEMSPRKAHEFGMARAGHLRVPIHNGLIFDFLKTEWRNITHKGVEIDKLIYDDDVLNGHRGESSPFPNQHGRWPFRYDPDDVSHIYFQDPSTDSWHVIPWVKAAQVGLPFSSEALRYARKAAIANEQPFDEELHLARLLERWDAGLSENVSERRMRIRQDQERAPLHTTRYQGAIPPLPMATRTALGLGANTDTDEDDMDDEAERDTDDFYGDLLDTGL